MKAVLTQHFLLKMIQLSLLCSSQHQFVQAAHEHNATRGDELQQMLTDVQNRLQGMRRPRHSYAPGSSSGPIPPPPMRAPAAGAGRYGAAPAAYAGGRRAFGK